MAMTHNSHDVRLYQDRRFHNQHVPDLIERALDSGHAVLVAARPNHNTAIEATLKSRGRSTLDLIASGRVSFIDARALLPRITVHRWPDRDLFMRIVGERVKKLVQSHGKVFVHGEIVDVLWQEGSRAAAVRLEELWNELAREASFTLSCGYHVDLLDPDVATDDLEGIVRTHTGLTSGQDAVRVETALQLAIRDVLGGAGAELIKLVLEEEGGPASRVARSLMWLRRKMPDVTPEILRRARALSQSVYFDVARVHA